MTATFEHTYDIGDKVTVSATFENASGVLTDPSTVVFILRSPSRTETTYTYGSSSEVTKTSTGVFAFAVPTFTEAGNWVVRAKGTAGLITAGESIIRVTASNFVTP